MKIITLTDDKVQIIALIASLVQHGFDFQYNGSSTSLIINVYESTCEQLSSLLSAHNVQVKDYKS